MTFQLVNQLDGLHQLHPMTFYEHALYSLRRRRVAPRKTGRKR